jgi:hypothetical protein
MPYPQQQPMQTIKHLLNFSAIDCCRECNQAPLGQHPEKILLFVHQMNSFMSITVFSGSYCEKLEAHQAQVITSAQHMYGKLL